MFRVGFNLHVSVWFELLNSFNEIGLKSSFALNRITHKLHLTFCFKIDFSVVELKMWPSTCFYFLYLWWADLFQSFNTQHNMFKSNCKPPTSILYLQNLNVDTHPKPFFGLSFLWDLFLISAFFWDQISKCILTCMPDLLSKVPSKAKAARQCREQKPNAESCSWKALHLQLHLFSAVQVCSSLHPPIAISSLANKCMFN